MIWGNSDGPQAQKMIQNSKYNIHLNLRIIGNNRIIGLSEIDQPVMIDPEKLRGSILVTHKPPLVKLLMKPYANAPKFHISGHLHSIKSVRKFPSVTAIQVPTLQSGEFALFNTKSEKVEFHHV
jgi:Icc-related predicted phosphoesterase